MNGCNALLVVCLAPALLAASEPQRLGNDGRIMLAPAFVSEQEIVYSVHESPNLVALVRLNVKDGSRTRVHPGITAHQFDAAYSRDGRWHCYAMSSNSPQLVLVIQDLKEKQEFVFRPRDARAVVRSPSISPDGKRVVFSLSDAGGQQIASVNMQGQDLKKLTESAGNNTSPAYSRDGKHIAFSSSRDGDFEIYVMDADGANVRRLTKSPSLDTRPSWSPDGTRLAFTSNRDGNYEIYVMNADGSAPRRLTDNPGKDDFPVWHLDGKRILFVSERKGKYDLYLLDVAEKDGDADGKDAWIEPMRKVHTKFTGTKGTLALFGDSITVSQAFWSPLAGEPKKLSDEGKKAHELVKNFMKPECWNKWRGPEFGNEGRMTIRWAHDNVDKWLKKLNPEVALIMFGTNDVGQVPAKEYEEKMREVVERCLKNGTVVILSTIPPRSGRLKESRQLADIARKVAKEKQVPLLDYFDEIMKRRPDDWDGSLAKFKDTPGSEYEVPTLISRDGVHPSNPQKYRDFTEESLRCNGYLLRSYLTLLKYREVIERVLQP